MAKAKGGGLLLMLDEPNKKPVDEDEEDDMAGILDDGSEEDSDDDEGLMSAPEDPALAMFAETALGTDDPERIDALKQLIRMVASEGGM